MRRIKRGTAGGQQRARRQASRNDANLTPTQHLCTLRRLCFVPDSVSLVLVCTWPFSMAWLLRLVRSSSYPRCTHVARPSRAECKRASEQGNLCPHLTPAVQLMASRPRAVSKQLGGAACQKAPFEPQHKQHGKRKQLACCDWTAGRWCGRAAPSPSGGCSAARSSAAGCPCNHPISWQLQSLTPGTRNACTPS